MLSVLSSAGRAYLRAFVAAIVVLAPGILAAPNLNRMELLGTAALIAAIGAGVRGVQAYAPEVSFVKYLGHPVGDWLDAALQAFLGSLVITVPGVLGAPDLSTGKALATSAILAALGAAARVLQGAVTHGEYPAPAVGLAEPEMPYSYQYPARRPAP